MTGVLMVSQPTTAGVAQCVLDWSIRLEARGWDVTVACPTNGDLSGWCRDRGLAVVEWEAEHSPLKGVPGEVVRLHSLLSACAPDVVLLHSSKAGLSGRLAMRGRIPTVFAPHAWSFDATRGTVRAAALAWERFAMRWTDMLLCVGDDELAHGRDCGLTGPAVIARNGVDADELQLLVGRTRATVRLELDLGDALVVTCLGRLSQQKGQDIAIEAWHRSPVPAGWRLVLVGSGPDEVKLRKLAGGDTTIVFAGAASRAEALAWLAAADLSVVPSRWEGMALVPLESLAVGTPVVASNIPGLREAVTPDLGSLVPAENSEALRTALDSWLDRSAKARLAARSSAAAAVRWHFSLERTVDEVESALEQAMAGSVFG